MHNVLCDCMVSVLFLAYGLKNCDEIFKPISSRGNRNHVITFDSYLKTTLSVNLYLLDMNWGVNVLSSKSVSPRLRGEAFLTNPSQFKALALTTKHQLKRNNLKRLIEQSRQFWSCNTPLRYGFQNLAPDKLKSLLK